MKKTSIQYVQIHVVDRQNKIKILLYDNHAPTIHFCAFLISDRTLDHTYGVVSFMQNLSTKNQSWTCLSIACLI